jgi:hypothetical protein
MSGVDGVSRAVVSAAPFSNAVPLDLSDRGIHAIQFRLNDGVERRFDSRPFVASDFLGELWVNERD